MLPLSASYSDYLGEVRALSRAKHEGFIEAIPALADRAASALVPAERKALLDRLTLLGMSMMHGKRPEEQQAWLHESARLLSDIPQAILFEAIDECVKEPGRIFAPTVGEIREKAAAPLQKAEREAACLRRLAKLIEEGADIPEWVEPEHWGLAASPSKAEPYCSPEEAAKILQEYGFKSKCGTGAKLAAMLKPAPTLSRGEMIAQGIVPPPIKPSDDGPLTV